MTIVIDASVAVKWVIDEPGSDAADMLLDEELIAPALWITEAANALWRTARTGEITTGDAARRLAQLLAAPVASLPIEMHLMAAFGLTTELSHPIYDCLYLAVAIARNAQVVTDDRRFAAAVANHPELAGRVRLLGS